MTIAERNGGIPQRLAVEVGEAKSTVDALKRLVGQEGSMAAAARRLGVTRTAVSGYLQCHEPSGVNGQGWSGISLKERAVKCYASGRSYRATAGILGVTHFKVAECLKGSSVSIRHRLGKMSAAELRALSQKKLEAALGDQLSPALSDLKAGRVTIKKLAQGANVHQDTFGDWLRKSGNWVPKSRGRNLCPPCPSLPPVVFDFKGHESRQLTLRSKATFFDLLKLKDPIAVPILNLLRGIDFPLRDIITMTDQELIEGFNLSEAMVRYLREQSLSHGIVSPNSLLVAEIDLLGLTPVLRKRLFKANIRTFSQLVACLNNGAQNSDLFSSRAKKRMVTALEEMNEKIKKQAC